MSRQDTGAVVLDCAKLPSTRLPSRSGTAKSPYESQLLCDTDLLQRSTEMPTVYIAGVRAHFYTVDILYWGV